ncbi:hypothetical protein G9A89_002670 [Geosiphon pyriformis]|nr:hypothetical protein G9A89_002670 [Geosiphon pyriformis]
MVKKTKSSEKWGQLLVFAIVMPNPFVVLNKILSEISIVLSSILSKISQDQPLAVLSNVVFFGRLSPVLKAKQLFSIMSFVLENWADQIETESSSLLVSDAADGVELMSSVYLATLKIAKFLVISEFGSFPAAIVLHDMSLSMSAANIKSALGVFGEVFYVVLKPTSIWQYVVVYFKELNAAASAFTH